MLLHEFVTRARSLSKRTWLVVAAFIAGAAGLVAWGVTALATVAPELKQGAGDVPAVIRERAGSKAPAAADVSGSDLGPLGDYPGPVGRYPGLIRTEFSREAATTTVRYVGYAGRAPVAMVLAHYTNGFAGAGYAHEVLSAAPGHERHRFLSDGSAATYELSLDRRDGGVLFVTLAETPATSRELQ